MKIKDNLFVTNLTYQAFYFADNKDDIKQIENLDYLENLSDDKWSIFLMFDIVGLENFKDRKLENDGLILLTYSKLQSNELRFDGMQGTQIKNEEIIKNKYGMSIPHGVDINNIDNVYLKILYIPNAFAESPDNTDPFHYMLNDSENELAKLTFPLPLLKRGNVNE
ncbi:hypothetical protein [Staphylococcus equorum]|uniref:Uncharacterized protein n=1 Tax=Staphylococcus equorum TaxID=246432 RepID=A0AAP7IDU1_9STAP|nr:hypothetical protein [Staphylococcus equorum]OEK56309.1 hypothetical protein ASS94_06870 [Staphylococcus equorum]